MRYYTNGSGGYFNHHVLLDSLTLSNIAQNNDSADLYCSVQTYDCDGKETASQLVFDIDNSSLVDAYTIARSIADDVEYEYDTDTSIWFSGSKGFHVVTGLVGIGSKANIAMKEIAHKFSDEIDDSMYKTRSLFRLPHSLNGKSGLRKIQVKYNESIQSITDRAKTRQPSSRLDLVYDNAKFNSDHAKAVSNIREYTPKDVVAMTGDWKESLPPCVVTLIEKGIPVGNRWEMAFWLVRHWRLHGIDVDGAIALSKTTPFPDHYTEGMIHHYYQGIMRGVGCHGVLEDLMHSECSLLCRHSDGWSDRTTASFIRGLNERDVT